MKTEKIYSEIYAYLKTLNEEDKKRAFHALEKGEYFTYEGAAPFFTLTNLLLDLRADLRSETAKSVGRTDIFKAAIEIIKSAEKSSRPYHAGAVIENGSQYVCDGYSAIRLAAPMDLPVPAEKRETNFKKVFDDTSKNSHPLNLPDTSELRAYIKLKTAEQSASMGHAKNKPPIQWDFGEGLPLVNAKYLLNIVQGLPECKAKIGEYRTDISPIYFEGSDGSAAVLCPMRRTESKAA